MNRRTFISRLLVGTAALALSPLPSLKGLFFPTDLTVWHHAVFSRKFGKTSTYFDGEQCSSMPIALSNDWNFGTEDFMMDFFVKAKRPTRKLVISPEDCLREKSYNINHLITTSTPKEIYAHILNRSAS